MDEPKFMDPYGEIRRTGQKLPHWQQDGAAYFVTFRLADSVPHELMQQWIQEREVWLSFHPEPWTREVELEYFRQFPNRIEEWLDAGHGTCLLRRIDCACIVGDAIGYFDGERCDVHAAVVMPNHVHLAVTVRSGWTLEQLVHSWKRFTARKLNELTGLEGKVWQRDYFDRMIRDSKHFERVIRYIRGNPERAKLREGQFWLYESDAVRAWRG